ncbi:O-methyltransferase [Planococcus sp. CAU13]|uniref:O-methyltransferase n=1 Tax=Planococcus sp. CAU13 TaxID=1541197 RepID=UPI00052FF923|nr:O-methyltransferase [Planococcus sp. CAU13]
MKETNAYINEVFTKPDEVLAGVITSIEQHGMRQISVPPASGKLLTMLVSISAAKNVLEIGALGGYSGICLARGFGSEGKLTSLELEESFAQLAKQNLSEAGFGDQVTYLTGPALDSLKKLSDSGESFDFFFIDADKENYENYLEACLKIAQPGAVIVADNVLAGGTVADPTLEPKQNTEIMKSFNQVTANHPKLESLLIPVGDGMTVSQVKK